jgi:glycosyltransferase involved in cell wall biosynthesis
MRVLAVNWRDLANPEAGGAEVHLHEILAHLVRWGHEATLLAAGWPGCAPEETIDGIRVLRRGHWFDANVVLPLFARRHLKHRAYDVVIEDINKLPFFMPFATALPVVPVIPHLFGTTAFRETNACIAAYVVLMERLIPLVFRTNRFMVISPSTKDDLVERGIAPGRIDVVLCGLDHDRYRDLALERFEAPTIVHLGRLRKYKSVEVALRALVRIRERLPEATLAIVGDGPYRGALEAEARRLGLGPSVRFLGHVPEEALVEFLNRAHLLVNPSPKEGWGLTVVEANACGLPVVASDRPGLRDSVRDGETGFLVPYGDDAAFAEKALTILEDRELWGRMSAAALERVKELTWERCARETLAVLAGVIAGGKGRS